MNLYPSNLVKCNAFSCCKMVVTGVTDCYLDVTWILLDVTLDVSVGVVGVSCSGEHITMQTCMYKTLTRSGNRTVCRPV